VKVNGVLGPIDTAELGQTLMHEHVTCADWSMRMNFGNAFFDQEAIKELAILRFKEAKEYGIRTVVDGTPINLGRDIHLIRDVAEASGVNIIASTGFYHQMEPHLAARPERQLKELMLRECTEGINGTGILPGIFKIAVDRPGVNDFNRKLLRAVGEVAAEMGLPVFCHTTPAIHNGDEALDILVQCGVPAGRIIVGHSGDSDDPDYLETLLEKGAWLGMDRFDPICAGEASFEQRVSVVAELCRRGWGNKLFLSHDTAAYLCFFDYWGAHKEQIWKNSEGMLTRIHREVIPALLEQGVSQETVDQMMADNPRRFFEGV